MSRLAAEMERNGFLVRERDPDDQRQYRLRLTDEGRAQHAAMRTNFHERYEQWVTHMTAAERAALLKGLPALIRVMRELTYTRGRSGSSSPGFTRRPWGWPPPTGQRIRWVILGLVLVVKLPSPL